MSSTPTTKLSMSLIQGESKNDFDTSCSNQLQSGIYDDSASMDIIYNDNSFEHRTGRLEMHDPAIAASPRPTYPDQVPVPGSLPSVAATAAAGAAGPFIHVPYSNEEVLRAMESPYWSHDVQLFLDTHSLPICIAEVSRGSEQWSVVGGEEHIESRSPDNWRTSLGSLASLGSPLNRSRKSSAVLSASVLSPLAAAVGGSGSVDGGVGSDVDGGGSATTATIAATLPPPPVKMGDTAVTKIVYANKAYATLMGCTKQIELFGKELHFAYEPPEFCDNTGQQQNKAGQEESQQAMNRLVLSVTRAEPVKVALLQQRDGLDKVSTTFDKIVLVSTRPLPAAHCIKGKELVLSVQYALPSTASPSVTTPSNTLSAPQSKSTTGDVLSLPALPPTATGKQNINDGGLPSGVQGVGAFDSDVATDLASVDSLLNILEALLQA
jgi:hypothetical protein